MKFDGTTGNEQDIHNLLGGWVLVHFIALIGARFDAPVPNIRETSGGRCVTYDRDIFIIWLL